MCGICGIIHYGNPPVEEEHLRRMCRTMTHRGPDDEGIYLGSADGDPFGPVHAGLGHRRLSIIDLSEAGHQPMSNEDGTLWIAYNGEIYNFESIRAELIRKGHRFKSRTDSEVILHLYEEEGVRAVERLNGIFAFALWDSRACRLWLCRDRVGVKPLVYFRDGGGIVFASEIKALLALNDIPGKLNADALQLYLAFNYIPAPLTIFQHIYKLEPAHSLVLEKNELSVFPYWEVPGALRDETGGRPFDEQRTFFKGRLYEEMNRAVASQMIADVPLGAFLSGGIDSSVIVALMARNAARPIQTFSIGFQGEQLFDETRYALDVAEMHRTDHHEFKLAPRDMLNVLDDVLSMFDEPFADSSAIPTFIISRETRKFVTVALSGDGGDELFAGYRSYLAHHWHEKYTSIPALFRIHLFERLIRNLPDSRDNGPMEHIRRIKKFIRGTKGPFPERLLALKEIFPHETRGSILRKDILPEYDRSADNALAWIEARISKYQGSVLDTALYADFKDSLPGDMLAKVDWMSMRNSLEVRVPILDQNVVELAFQMPDALKIHKGKTKFIFKETFQHLLPASLQNRPKAGFEIPISRWLKTDLSFLIEEYLAEKRIQAQGLFEYPVIREQKRQFQSGRMDNSWMLWNLIVFQYWFDRFFNR